MDVSPSAATSYRSASSARASRRPRPSWQGSAMGLTSGSGPFGDKPAGDFNFTPDPPTGSVLYFDPVPYRLRGLFAGETVFDTLGAKLLYETAHLPVYYVPEEDLRHDLLEPSETQMSGGSRTSGCSGTRATRITASIRTAAVLQCESR